MRTDDFIEVIENARNTALYEANNFLIKANKNKIFNNNKYINLSGLNSACEAIMTANKIIRKIRGHNNA